MTALVIPFPRSSPIHALVRPAAGSEPFSAAWFDEHAPLIAAGLQLLACDDAEFGRRCQAMRDADGRAMLDELAGQMERLGAGIANVADALSLTATRIRVAMIAPA